MLGKIIKDRYPDLNAEDQEAVRQHAIAALNLTKKLRGSVRAEPRVTARRGLTRPSSMVCAGLRWMSENWTST